MSGSVLVCMKGSMCACRAIIRLHVCSGGSRSSAPSGRPLRYISVLSPKPLRAMPFAAHSAAADEIDWQALLATPLDADAFAEGTAKQICKAAGSKGKARRQMLPDGEPVQVRDASL